jgi:hypothetical protein
MSEESKEIKCQFCDKFFTTKSNLTYHQKNTISCLEKQGKKKKHVCNFCNKELTTNERLISHLNVCKGKEKMKDLDDIIKREREYKLKIKELEDTRNNEKEEYKLKIKELEDTLKKERYEYILKIETMLKETHNAVIDIAKQPKTINTSNNNSHNDNRIKSQNNSQTFDINDVKRINNVLETYLTPEVLAKGQKGVAEMLKEHLLKNENGELIYECSDVSRQKFEFINKHGYTEPDPKAAKLISSLNNANIFDVAHSTGKKLWETEEGVNHDAQNVHMPKVTEVLQINEDSSKFRSHLASITSK